MSDERKEGEGDDAFVTVKISRELLAMLSEKWTGPVHVMIAPPFPGSEDHQMIAMKHECEKSA